MTTRANRKIIVNEWESSRRNVGIRVSHVVDGRDSCEGIHVCRYLSEPGSRINLSSDQGHIFSLLEGEGVLKLPDEPNELAISAGTHIYVPPSRSANFRFLEQSSAIHAFAPANRPHGEKLLVHNERYMATSRFVLTPQYLSRRAFLNRDHTLVSKSGDRVAWFHTTMFDTQGLPLNHDGLPVFKMSYDHQTEINVIFDVGGEASARFAQHPYVDAAMQRWSDWHVLDDQTTYYLNEGARGPDVERFTDPKTGKEKKLRNRHEIYISPGGHVSLCCLFDPGPTGLETHQPGEYSSYAPVSETVDTPAYQEFVELVSVADNMIQTLSYDQASNAGKEVRSYPAWAEYEKQLAKALNADERVIRAAQQDRRQIMEAWRIYHK